MTLTGTSARFELLASADLTSEGVSGSAQIGTPLTTVVYSTAPNIAYSMIMSLSQGGTLFLDTGSGIVTGTVAGVFQVETATVVAASGITGNGNATCVFTSPLVTGSPLSTSVAVTTALATATAVAGAIRTALQGVAAITDHYTIGGTGATITATALVKAANNTSLNISTANGTCTGITTAATSANTTAGVGASNAYRLSGINWDATDAEGKPLPAATKLYGMLVKSISGTGAVEISGSSDLATVDQGQVNYQLSEDGTHQWSDVTVIFQATTGTATITVDIQAGT